MASDGITQAARGRSTGRRRPGPAPIPRYGLRRAAPGVPSLLALAALLAAFPGVGRGAPEGPADTGIVPPAAGSGAPAAPGGSGGPSPRPGPAAMRIISLAPSLTEILFAIGAGDRLVGVCNFCDHPAEVARVPRVGTFTAPSIEAILAARPDLLMAVRGPATMDAVEAVRRLGIDTLVVEDSTLDAVWAAIDSIGARSGRAAAAAELAAAMRGRFAAIRDRVAGAPRRRVLMVVGQTPLVVAGGGTFADELIQMAGGTNVAADSAQAWPRLSLEAVLARAPEVIIDSALSHEEGADPGLWARFPSLPAVRNDRVHPYSSFAALRGGPRLVEAAEEFARLIHPERYQLPSGGDDR